MVTYMSADADCETLALELMTTTSNTTDDDDDDPHQHNKQHPDDKLSCLPTVHDVVLARQTLGHVQQNSSDEEETTNMMKKYLKRSLILYSI